MLNFGGAIQGDGAPLLIMIMSLQFVVSKLFLILVY